MLKKNVHVKEMKATSFFLILCIVRLNLKRYYCEVKHTK